MRPIIRNSLEFVRQYWYFYVSLENDFLDTEQYVSMEEDNFSTYSIRYNRILQATCSEIDVIMKLVKDIYEASGPDNINNYYNIIASNCKNLISEKVEVKLRGLNLVPWERENGETPNWWLKYQKIKHERTTINSDTNKPYYKFANLKNVLNALAALYIAEMYLLAEVVVRDETSDDGNVFFQCKSKIFELPRWNQCYQNCYGSEKFDKQTLEIIIKKSK